ncbi:MAG: hypothetical protein HPY53_12770 [Brevinematales bacterium]|nr:hypothetical protein [Brevinematales bacterium]
MKRVLGVLLAVFVGMGVAQAKYYSYKKAALKIDVPSGWGIQEKQIGDGSSFLEVTSPNSEVIIYLHYYDKGGFGDYSDKEEYKYLEERLVKILGRYVTVVEKFTEKVNGMKVYAITANYTDKEYGEAFVYCGAFETGKQLSTLVVDVLKKDYPKFKAQVNKIIDSAKKLY